MLSNDLIPAICALTALFVALGSLERAIARMVAGGRALFKKT